MFKEKLNKDFIIKFTDYIEKNKLIPKRSKIVVGFSGGADSTALLLSLLIIKDRLDLSILVAHVNYNLRGDDSLEDEEAVKQFCFEHNLYLVIKNVEMQKRSNVENSAREIRMGFFAKLVKDYKLDSIVLGHNRGDVAETVLMNLVRGAGISGLKGILAKSRNIIHPLLDFSREEIVQFLNSEEISWREDKSNNETHFTRNKIRNQLIPWIADNMNPAVQDKLVFFSSLMKDSDSFFNDYITARYKSFVLSKNDKEISLSLKKISSINSLIRYYLIKRVIFNLTGIENDIYSNHISEIENIIDSNGSKVVCLPHNIYVLKQYDEIRFTTINPFTKRTEKKVEPRVLSSLRPRLTYMNYRINLKKIKKMPSNKALTGNRNVVFLDFDEIKLPLIIRTRENGDKFIPLGLKGFKKVKDFFIDEKVPKFDRDKILFITDSEKILWIGGMRIDNRVALSDSTKNILRIEIEKLSDKKLRSAERILKD